jgi:hypothetical protein
MPFLRRFVGKPLDMLLKSLTYWQYFKLPTVSITFKGFIPKVEKKMPCSGVLAPRPELPIEFSNVEKKISFNFIELSPTWVPSLLNRH